MEISEAKALVIEAGKRLVESGLIARTWGNVSCRISDTQFVITPSGRAYETLTPEEIVLVNIADLSYDGDIKPSSEKGIHASAYRLRREVNFVIHTHQRNASVVSAVGTDINNITGEAREILGDSVTCASYGLPGTSKLRKGVVAAINRSSGKAIIMAHHGALCMGESYDEAFLVAKTLEDVCESFLVERYKMFKSDAGDTFASLRDYVSDVFASADGKKASAPVFAPCESERLGDCFSITEDGSRDTAIIDIKSGALVGGRDLPDSADMHMAVYKKREDINNIIHSNDEDIVAMSKNVRTHKPMLDDFAQLVGPTIRSAIFNPNDTLATSKKVAKALKGRNAVLLKNNGALCAAGTKSDAEAVELVCAKECRTRIGSELFDTGKSINPVETRLMRLIYLKKYSKQKK